MISHRTKHRETVLDRNLQTHYVAQKKRVWDTECNKGFIATCLRKRKKPPQSQTERGFIIILPFSLLISFLIDGFPSRFQADPSNPQSRSIAEYIASPAVLVFFLHILSFKRLLAQSP